MRPRVPLTFTPTYAASLGRDPSWRGIERSKLAVPIASDYALVADAR